MPRLKVFFLVFFFSLMLTLAAYYCIRSFNDFMQKPIGSVELIGDFTFLSKDGLLQLINKEMQRTFISENLTELQRKLNSNPWIDTVALRRKWPDTLLVTVVEQRPIARWGDRGFVNFRGELVSVNKHSGLQLLPVLRGADSDSYEMMKQFQLLSQLLNKHELKLAELEKNHLGVWTLFLENGWQVKAGRTEAVKKVQLLVALLQSNKIEEPNDIRVIDMRYNNGMAIQRYNNQQHNNQHLAVRDRL